MGRSLGRKPRRPQGADKKEKEGGGAWGTNETRRLEGGRAGKPGTGRVFGTALLGEAATRVESQAQCLTFSSGTSPSLEAFAMSSRMQEAQGDKGPGGGSGV